MNFMGVLALLFQWKVWLAADFVTILLMPAAHHRERLSYPLRLRNRVSLDREEVCSRF